MRLSEGVVVVDRAARQSIDDGTSSPSSSSLLPKDGQRTSPAASFLHLAIATCKRRLYDESCPLLSAMPREELSEAS
jgi:hypothetical protein